MSYKIFSVEFLWRGLSFNSSMFFLYIRDKIFFCDFYVQKKKLLYRKSRNVFPGHEGRSFPSRSFLPPPSPSPCKINIEAGRCRPPPYRLFLLLLRTFSSLVFFKGVLQKDLKREREERQRYLDGAPTEKNRRIFGRFCKRKRDGEQK